MKILRFLCLSALITTCCSAIYGQASCGTVTDYDGNVYPTVQLGNQCWMAQNLRVTHYADGTALKHGADDPAEFCYYLPNNQTDNIEKYGLLYSWSTALRGATPTEDVPSGIQGICPDGWHLPSNFEWMGLEDFLGYRGEFRCGTDVNNVTKALSSQEGWRADFLTTGPECSIINNLSANNSSGMNVLPAGSFWNGSYEFGGYAGFWTASDGSDVTAPIHYFAPTNATVEINCTPKEAGYSIRCLKN